MRKTIAIYLSLVVAATILYGFTVFRWIDSKAVGLHAFPGSPDWAYMYGSSLERYFWLSGMLFGLALGGVALFAYARSSPSVSKPRWESGMIIASVVILIAALAVGYSAEQNTLQGGAAVGESGSNMPVERIVAAEKTAP